MNVQILRDKWTETRTHKRDNLRTKYRDQYKARRLKTLRLFWDQETHSKVGVLFLKSPRVHYSQVDDLNIFKGTTTFFLWRTLILLTFEHFTFLETEKNRPESVRIEKRNEKEQCDRNSMKNNGWNRNR